MLHRNYLPNHLCHSLFIESQIVGNLVEAHHLPQKVISRTGSPHEWCAVTNWIEEHTENDGHVNEVVA